MKNYKELYERFNRSEFANEWVYLCIADNMACMCGDDAFFNELCDIAKVIYLDGDIDDLYTVCYAVYSTKAMYGDTIIDWNEFRDEAEETLAHLM